MEKWQTILATGGVTFIVTIATYFMTHFFVKKNEKKGEKIGIFKSFIRSMFMGELSEDSRSYIPLVSIVFIKNVSVVNAMTKYYLWYCSSQDNCMFNGCIECARNLVEEMSKVVGFKIIGCLANKDECIHCSISPNEKRKVEDNNNG